MNIAEFDGVIVGTPVESQWHFGDMADIAQIEHARLRMDRRSNADESRERDGWCPKHGFNPYR
jgi:hypothetical protein